MVDALIGMGSGMLAASAAFGIVSQICKRQNMYLGVQIAGLLGTVVLLVALLMHGITAASLDYFLDTSGRALSIAGIGLLAIGLPIVHSRSLAASTATSTSWAFALAAILIGWAEFMPTAQEIAPTSPTILIALLVASGLAMAACAQALAAVQYRIKPKGNSAYRADSPQDALRSPSFYATMLHRARPTYLALTTAIILLTQLYLSIQSFVETGFFWPEAANFRAITGTWLILFSACLVKEDSARSILEIAGPLVLITVTLSGI